MPLPNITATPASIRDDFLRVIKNGLWDLGIQDANVSPGSDYWVMAEALGAQIAMLYNFLITSSDAVMPDTCTGEDLDRWLGIVGLERRDAGGSTGTIEFSTDFTTLVPTGAELTSASGQRYKVSQGGTYADGDTIPIESIDVGTQTNLDVPDFLTWASPPFGSQPTANLATALTGGVDAEVDDVARARLLDRLANPPSAANWSWIVEMCEALDPVIQKAFVYNVHNGPSTVFIALAGNPAEGSKSREIDSIKLNSTLAPLIRGSMPEYVETTITTVEDVETDVSFQITLPLATPSSSATTGPGNGTGWLDPTPWPAVNGTPHTKCAVTAVNSAQNFTVDSPAGVAPTAGSTRICWIDRTDWSVKQAKVVSYTGTGPYTVTTDLPFTDIAVGDYIFPASVNAQNYVDAALTAFELMGPGEKVDIGATPVAARRPRQNDRFPSNLDGTVLRYIINSGDEVQTAEYWYRSNTTPNTPAAAGDPPKIFIPRHLAFYPPYPLS